MKKRRLPPLGSLRAFEAAARLSSFKDAAAELSITPGAVSQQIRALEDELGVKLFTRSARAVSPTEAGKRLQPSLAAALRHIREAVDDARADLPSSLRVNSSGPIIGKWLLPRLHRFTQRYPELAVSIQSVNGLVNVAGGDPDVFIRWTRAVDPEYFAVKLCDEYLLPLASPELIARLELRAPRDLVRAPLLHDVSCQVFPGSPDWRGWFVQAGLDPKGADRGMRFDRHAADHAIDAAANGAGVVLARRFLARADMLSGRLVAPFGPTMRLDSGYFVICRRGDETRPSIAAFINWMAEEAAVFADGAPTDAIIA